MTAPPPGAQRQGLPLALAALPSAAASSPAARKGRPAVARRWPASAAAVLVVVAAVDTTRASQLLSEGRATAVAAVSASSSSAAATASAAASNETKIGAIPDWRLDVQIAGPGREKLAPTGGFPLPLEGMNGQAVGYQGQDVQSIIEQYYAPGSATPHGDSPAFAKSSGPPLTPVSSTAGQDSQRCPIIQLPAELSLQAREESSEQLFSLPGRQTGRWVGPHYAVLSTWMENFWSPVWKTTYIRAGDGQTSLKIVPRTEAQLMNLYGWKEQSQTYPVLETLDAKFGMVASSTDTVIESLALTDCEDNLMFVVRVQQGLPYRTDVYDRVGGLAAHGLVDTIVARTQLVDKSGNLLATAESPGLGLNVTRPAPPASGERADAILDYVLRFEPGGYTNASRLLDQEYRWVLASAVQARALMDAYGGWTPWTASTSIWIAYGSIALLIVLMFFACVALLRLVYPVVPGSGGYRNPFLKTPDQWKHASTGGSLLPTGALYT